MPSRVAGRSAAALLLVLAALDGAPAGERPRHHCHTLPPPKVLYVAGSPKSELLAEALRHNVPADVSFAPLNYGDLEFHHLCDKPLEETKEDRAYVRRQGAAHVDSLLARIDQFDVVIAQIPTRSERQDENARLFEIQKRLVSYARGGGKLVVINPGWETTFQGTPLAGVVPVKFVRHKSWVYSCGRATDHPLTRGIPLEVTGAHFYGPVYEPVDATCVPLAGQDKRTRFWYRRLPSGGEVVHLFQVGGQKHQWQGGTNAATYDPERPDDGAAWNAFYRRLICGLTYGDKAFPLLVKIDLPATASCRWGETLAVPVDVENRSNSDREVVIQLEISHRRSDARVTNKREITLKRGERRVLRFEAPARLPCTDSWLLVNARALHAGGKAILSESTSWVPLIHAVPLTVKTDKRSYRPGERIRATFTWGKESRPRKYLATACVVDRSGRVLERVPVAAESEGGGSARLSMPDWGPELAGCYWVTAVIRSGDHVAGTARAQVQLDRPWTMREQFQWSLWTWGGGGRKIDLFRDAGFNCLGYPGNCYTADRYGMRQYVESAGINTFSVTIDHDNWDDVRASMNKTIDNLEKGGPDARSKSLVSLGEESGFKGGWGRRYYWPQDKAPATPQKVFDDYLRGLYGGRIDALNEEWGTAHASFDEIPLEKDKVKMPARVFVTSQAWEAMQKKGEARHVIPVDVKRLDAKRKYVGRSAPYYETYRFFDWYYQKYCDLASEVYKARRNPVPLTIMSAPGGFYPKVDVYNFGGQGPFYPKEAALAGNAAARRTYGDVPGFSAAMWAYFDLRPLWSCTVLSSILAGNTHIDYWVDIPLTFNADLTHTRASFWTKVLRRRLHPIEPILLHKRFSSSDGLGMMLGDQPLPKGILGKHFGSAISCSAPIYSALEKSGYMPKVVDARRLKDIEVLVASYAQVLSAEEGKQIGGFVRRGGLLISTPWLASCSPHGNVLTVYPAEESGLGDLLGFKLLNTSQEVVKEEVSVDLTGHFPTAGRLALVSKGRDTVLEMAPDVEVLAQYKDGTPLLLTRRVERGRVVHVNLIYDWDHWWNSFHEPAREAYRKLIDGILRADGRVRPEYFIAFQSAEPVQDSKGWWGMQMRTKPKPGESIAWWASQLYGDPNGRIKYLATFADHRSPKVTGRLKWAVPNVRILDLFNGKEIPTRSGHPLMTLRPGEAAFWAFAPKAPTELRITTSREAEAGKPVRVQMQLRGADSDAVYGVVLDVHDPSGRRSGAHSLSIISAPNGRAEVEIPTAVNDPPGEYRIVATESMTRARGEARFRLTAPGPVLERHALTPFPPRASENWPVPTMTSQEFLEGLRRLRTIYEGTYAGLEAKYMLSYYLNVPFRPNNRHATVRRLQRTHWKPHLKAVAEAVRSGERFCLFGEDLNIDPLTEMTIDPLAAADPPAFLAALAGVAGARRRIIEIDGMTFSVVQLGEGAVVSGDASVDRAAYHSSDFLVWHAKLKNALKRTRR